MMTISLSEVSKRFNRDWIFRKFSYSFTKDYSYSITGPNGSGKSTLLQVIGGAIALSEGEILYEAEGPELAGESLQRKNTASNIQHSTSAIHRIIPAEDAYRFISIAAPYLEVVEEMTATEFLEFHKQFKPLLPGYNIREILSITGLETAAAKQIRYYSSGMKQRIKLAQAVFSNTPVLLLDEPCTNLDAEGVQLYQTLINDYCKNRLVIVSSNDMQEYGFCEKNISILDYKH